MAKKTNSFSQALATTVLTSPSAAMVRTGPSAVMRALFAQKQMPEMAGFKKLNLPPLLKPSEKDGTANIPEGGIMSAIIVDAVDSPVSTVQGALLWLHLVKRSDSPDAAWEKTGTEITFPATGVIRSALAPGVEGREQRLKALSKWKGHLLMVQRLTDKMSKYNKPMTMWDVRISTEKLDIGVRIN